MLAYRFLQESIYLSFLLLFSSLALTNCNGKEEQHSIVLLYPADRATYPIGEDVLVAFDLNKDDIIIDSTNCFVNGKAVLLAESDIATTYVLHTSNCSLGEHEITIEMWCNNGISHSYKTKIILLSDLTPTALSYQVMQQYPHDTADFTQGLFYENDIMYEGTGLDGQSKIKKYALNNGKVFNEHKLPNDVFGEGVTVINNKIYQTHYKDKIGSIYDKNSFLIKI